MFAFRGEHFFAYHGAAGLGRPENPAAVRSDVRQWICVRRPS